jgi:CBS domain-containing protein
MSAEEVISMKVKEIMTQNPKCAQTSTSLQQVAQMMIDCDCVGVPVCDTQGNKLVGFVTDRDIVCRILAQGVNPIQKTAQDAMSTDLHTIRPDASVEDCIQMMERYQVRRILVTDNNNQILGIVAQADLARQAEQHPELKDEVEDVIEQVSEPKVLV